MQEAVDTLLLPRWLIPVVPEGAVLEGQALAIRDGRIHAVLPAAEAQHRYQASAVVELPEHALIPGLINLHTHAAMNLLRGFADDLPLMEWLNNHIWPAEGRWVSPEFVRDGSLLAIAEMLRGGITCCNDMYFFPDAVAEAARAAGMRIRLGIILIEFPSAWAKDAAEYLDKGLALRERYRNDPLIGFTLAPHAPYTVSAANLARVAKLAESLDLPIHIHVHETATEVEDHLARHGCRPWRSLKELGLVSRRLIAVHMTQLSDEEIHEAAAAGVSVVHCPESNLKLASGFCPVARLIAAGVNVALGTDGAASNNDLDLFGEMRTAALLAKGVAADASALPAARVLTMATLNGARALGLEAELGSLEPGKWADLAAVELGGLESQPLYHPISQLVYATGRQQVSDVWVAGRRLLDRRRLTTLDAEELGARARQWRDRITG
ncbi:MAG TPA: TRZ/ATZ family hydrolase [Candidatus Competibacteraceae bacterium]|nr:TRZ/ATZ family hydrolase [Candidatus Competibacteraceae bacterium]